MVALAFQPNTFALAERANRPVIITNASRFPRNVADRSVGLGSNALGAGTVKVDRFADGQKGECSSPPPGSSAPFSPFHDVFSMDGVVTVGVEAKPAAEPRFARHEFWRDALNVADQLAMRGSRLLSHF